MKVSIVSNVSINELIEQMSLGYSGSFSPHLGSWAINRLQRAKDGFRPIVLNTNTLNDDIFHPDRKVRFGKVEDFPGVSKYDPNCIVDATSLKHIHLNSLVDAGLERGSISTTLEYFLGQDNHLLDIISTLGDMIPSCEWKQVVSSEGVLKKVEGYDTANALKNGLYGYEGSTEGFTLPLGVCILVMCIKEATKTGKQTVFHLSGEVMAKYISQYEKFLSEAFKRLKGSGKFCLPKELNLSLVPAANNLLITTRQYQSELDEIVNLWTKMDRMSRSGVNDRHARSNRDQLTSKVRANGKYFLGTPMKPGSMFTHYDVSEGGVVYEHLFNRILPVGKVSELIKSLRSLR